MLHHEADPLRGLVRAAHCADNGEGTAVGLVRALLSAKDCCARRPKNRSDTGDHNEHVITKHVQAVSHQNRNKHITFRHTQTEVSHTVQKVKTARTRGECRLCSLEAAPSGLRREASHI